MKGRRTLDSIETLTIQVGFIIADMNEVPSVDEMVRLLREYGLKQPELFGEKSHADRKLIRKIYKTRMIQNLISEIKMEELQDLINVFQKKMKNHQLQVARYREKQEKSEKAIDVAELERQLRSVKAPDRSIKSIRLNKAYNGGTNDYIGSRHWKKYNYNRKSIFDNNSLDIHPGFVVNATYEIEQRACIYCKYHPIMTQNITPDEMSRINDIRKRRIIDILFAYENFDYFVQSIPQFVDQQIDILLNRKIRYHRIKNQHKINRLIDFWLLPLNYGSFMALNHIFMDDRLKPDGIGYTCPYCNGTGIIKIKKRVTHEESIGWVNSDEYDSVELNNMT